MGKYESKFTISLRVTITQTEPFHGSSLSIEEEIHANATGLMELAGVLHQVHGLTEKIRDEQAGLAKGGKS